jgi:hypothetical protein
VAFILVEWGLKKGMLGNRAILCWSRHGRDQIKNSLLAPLTPLQVERLEQEFSANVVALTSVDVREWGCDGDGRVEVAARRRLNIHSGLDLHLGNHGPGPYLSEKK